MSLEEKLRFLEKKREQLEQGDKEAIENQHAQRKLTARERVSRLLDSGSFQELDLFHGPLKTGFDIDTSPSGGDGVIVGYGLSQGRAVSVWSQDATVLDGTVGTVHARKINMIMENALNSRTPIIAILDSAGLRPEDVVQYPEFYSTSTMAKFQTIASGVLPKISLVMGPCGGDLALVAGLGDFLFMVKNSSHMHLMPPPPGILSQDIGDPWAVHAKLTGCCDVIAENDEDCLDKCRKLLSFLPSNNNEPPPLAESKDDPDRREERLLEIIPADISKTYDMYELISLVVDNGELFEIKRHFAHNLITGFARLNGRSVGIIANNPRDRAGCMTLDAADKMSRFVRFCDAFNIPCIWFMDTPAFLPAVEEESRGLIRHGSRMIMANSEATVPQITLAIRKGYGGGRLAMPGQGLMGDITVAWPTFEPGMMAAEGAVNILYHKELEAITDKAERCKRWEEHVSEMRQGQDNATLEAAQVFIDPRDTRPFLIKALEWLKNRKQERPPRKHENFRM
ncbi:acyl-CoA carboxylase subunit beta [Chloroflexota bacterium]